jgi:hypothetical protein
MLIFEEDKPNCDDDHRNQTIPKRLASALKRTASSLFFLEKNQAINYGQRLGLLTPIASRR